MASQHLVQSVDESAFRLPTRADLKRVTALLSENRYWSEGPPMSNPWYARTLKAKSKPAVMRKQSDAALGTITGFDQLLTGQLAESGGTRQHLSLFFNLPG